MRGAERSRASLGLVVVLVLICVATASTAAAAIAVRASQPNPIWSNGTIHQCLNDKTFATRTLPRGRSCARGETGYSFNQRGVTGRSGAPGVAGYALVDDAKSATPRNDATRLLRKTTIKLTTRGSILVLDAVLYSGLINNNATQTHHYNVGLYLDGVAIPGTFRTGDQGVAPGATYYVATGPVTLSPVAVANVRPGTHTIAIAARADDGSIDWNVVSASARIFAVTAA